MGTSLGADFLPRLASALLLGPLMLLAAWWGGWPFAAVLLLASVLVLWEWVVMTALQPKAIVLALGGVSLATAGVAAMLAPTLTIFLVVALGVAALALAGEPRGWAAAGLAYAAAVLVPTLLLRIDPQVGAASIVWLFAVVWSTDIAAYFCGRLIGGPKLWPRISPKKTWSGAIGGTLLGTLAGLAAARLFDIPAAPGLIAASLAASIASQGGDLYESAMKRRFGVKDSSALIPGHGGLMDRLDGFVAAAVLALVIGLWRDPQAPTIGLMLW
ncbi:MAG: phosphatidate cytidylyltransferase [Microvirga sp.]|jgi:phosphatidate cytidylyltransferase|nr:phosphatidate cytidylyltransferase [Microvirga sp.]